MKGFRSSNKSFGFKTSAQGFAPGPQCFAKGGAVTIGDQGNTLQQRKEPVSQFDADEGGKTGLRTGYKTGGKVVKEVGKVHMKVASKLGAKEMLKKHPAKIAYAKGGAIDAAAMKNSRDMTARKPKGLPDTLGGKTKVGGVAKRAPTDVKFLAKGGSVADKIRNRGRDLDQAIDEASGTVVPPKNTDAQGKVAPPLPKGKGKGK